MTLAKEASCGGGVEVVRKWTGSIYGGLGGLIWIKESAGEFRRRSRVNISPRFLSSQTLKTSIMPSNRALTEYGLTLLSSSCLGPAYY